MHEETGHSNSPSYLAGRRARSHSRARDLGQKHPLSLIGIGVLLYSLGPVFVKASSISGVAFSFWRLWLGVGLLGAAMIVHMRMGGSVPSLHGWRWAVGAGLVFAAHQVVFMTSVKETSVVTVTLLGALSPVVTGALAIPFFGERPGTRFRVWSLLAMAGAAIVAVGAGTGPNGSPLGVSLAAINVVVFAVFFLMSKKGRDRIDVIPFLFGVIAVAAPAVTVFALVTGADVGAATARDILLASGTAIGPGFLGHFVMTWPLAFLPANVPPLVRLATPFLAGALAWIFLGETVQLLHVLGGVVTIAGVAGAIISPAGQLLMRQARDGSPAARDP